MLEKILEEIYKKSFSVEIREYESESAVLVDDVEYILRKCMNSGKDTNVPTKDNDGWIPVEQCSPSDGETVLCTDGEYTYMVEYDADLDAGFGDMDNIIAWQPLPKPYFPEKEKE